MGVPTGMAASNILLTDHLPEQKWSGKSVAVGFDNLLIDLEELF
jgi:hypothetical protein